jgi:hypothetical protein
MKLDYKYFVLLLIIAIGLGYAGMSMTLQQFSAVPQGAFAVPIWSRLECLPEDTYDGLTRVHYDSKNIASVPCGAEGQFTDKCNVYLDAVDPSWWTGVVDVVYKKCNMDGTGCDAQWTTKRCEEGASDCFIRDLNKGEKITMKCEGGLLNINRECDAIVKFRPWKLFQFEEGAKIEKNPKNCCILTSLTGSIPKDESYPTSSCLEMSGSEGLKWINYVGKWAYAPKALNIATYNGQEVFCTNNVIYSLAKMQMKDGSAVKIDPNYKPTTEDPDYFEYVGEPIKAVECCPSEPFCGVDFKKTATAKSCSSTLQCTNGGRPLPISSFAYQLEKCVGGTCTRSDDIRVQCTSNTACPAGLVCDLTLNNYGNCVKQDAAGYCGDKICQVSESMNSCSADCGLIQPKEDSYLGIILIVLAVLIIVLLVYLIRKKKVHRAPRRRNRRAPMMGGM